MADRISRRTLLAAAGVSTALAGPAPLAMDAAYAGVVLAPDAFARDNARALRAFIAGSAEGWRDYIRGDGRAADALIRQVNPAITQAHLDQSRTTLRQQGLVDGGDAALYGLGAMTDERWRDAFDAAAAEGRLPAQFDARFVNLWRYYLMYCEGGFRGGGIDVAQVTLVKAE